MKRLDPAHLEDALRSWVVEGLAISADPDALPGRAELRRQDALRDFAAAVHLLAAVDHQTGCVFSQLRVDAKTNEHKAALELPETLVFKGKVFTGDALLFCQKALCPEIVEQQADDFSQAEARTAARAAPPGTDNLAARIRSLTRNSRRLSTSLGIVQPAMALEG